jgi:amidohydrolase
MLQAGLYREFPRPDYALALHNDAELESGKIGICEGNVLAGVDSIDLTVRGVSGHGAFPAYTKDPIVLSAQIILALQTIVSRELRPTEPAVVTVGSIHGGTKHNIIPGEVQLQLTVRQYSDEVRNHILKSIDRIARGVALAAGVPEDRAPMMKVYEEENLPPTYNQPDLARRTAKAIAAILGEERVVKRDPVMGAEDFAFFGRTEERVPITLFWLGTVSPEKLEESRRSGLRLPSLHSSVFAPVPETTIRTGVTAMTAAALELFR